MEKKMAKLLIVYESRTGNTEAMAKAVYEGALSAGATVSLKKATEATCDELLDCDAVIFGSPTHFGYMAGTLQGFLEEVYVTLGNRSVTKPYAAFSIGDAGGRKTLESIDYICHEFAQWCEFKFEKATEGVKAKGKPTPEVLEECKELGKKIAQS